VPEVSVLRPVALDDIDTLRTVAALAEQ